MVVGGEGEGVFARELELVIGVVFFFFFLGKVGVCLWLFSEVMVERYL